MISGQGAHVAKGMILVGVWWYVAYPLSSRHVEALMEERGGSVDHATIHRWILKDSPLLGYLQLTLFSSRRRSQDSIGCAQPHKVCPEEDARG